MRSAFKVADLQRENRRLRKKAIELEKQLIDLKKMVNWEASQSIGLENVQRSARREMS